MQNLTFTCIGRNEVNHLKTLLPSLLATGAAVVYVDCESSDGSFEYAQSLGCECFRRENNMNLNINKSFAMEQARTPWLFYIDPDERLPADLLAEVKSIVGTSPEHAKVSDATRQDKSKGLSVSNPSCGSEGPAAYRLKRKNYYFDRWLRYGGQYPDYQLRLFLKERGKFPNRHVHESLEIRGAIGLLKTPMEHYPYETVSQFFKKFDFYSSFEAGFLYDRGVRPGGKALLRFVVLKPLSRFFRRYLLKRGFRDGIPGLMAALGDAWGWVVRYIKLWEIHKNKKNDKK